MAGRQNMARLSLQTVPKVLQRVTISNSRPATRRRYAIATLQTRSYRHQTIRQLSRAVRWQSNTPSRNGQELPQDATQPVPSNKLAEMLKQSEQEDLVSPVNIPSDPDGILQPDHPAMAILGNSSLVIQRQLELMNILLSFEQANRYIIMNGKGETVGYIAEQDHGIGRAIARQAAKTHRSFTTHVFDANLREVLRIHRPFAYINSRIRIYDPLTDQDFEDSNVAVASSAASSVQVSPLKLDDMRIIGESQQQWAALKRIYNLFTIRPSKAADIPAVSTKELSHATQSQVSDNAIEASMDQFSRIEEPLLSWDFTMRNTDGTTLGSVNRNFRGFGRELFTDTGAYALRMDAAAHEADQTATTEASQTTDVARLQTPGLTIDQRAVMIATAVSIDFDYFSRHSSMMGGMPLMIPMGGGAAEAGAAGAGVGAAGAAIETGAAGAGAGVLEGVGTGAVGAAGRSVAGAGAVESGIAGAGTMAGYEAMQRGFGRGDAADDASPQSAEPYQDPGQLGQAEGGQEDVWGTSQDPWAEQPTGSDSSSGDGEGGGLIQSLWDMFTGGD